MADEVVTPPPGGTPPAGSGSAPAPPGDTPAADPKTLLTAGDTPPAEPPKPGEKAPEAKPADPVIPEKYEFKAPDGKELDPAFADALTPVFKDMKLTQEQVSKLADTYNKFGVEAEKKAEADFQKHMADTAKTHVDAIKKEWGADFDGNLKIAQRGLARLFDGEGKRILDETGLGNHPQFLKAFLAVGKMIQEDTPPNGGSPTGRKPNEQVFYGQPNA
jgi:hypothetical protein